MTSTEGRQHQSTAKQLSNEPQLCICQLCTCGEHKCKAGTAYWNQPAAGFEDSVAKEVPVSNRMPQQWSSSKSLSTSSASSLSTAPESEQKGDQHRIDSVCKSMRQVDLANSTVTPTNQLETKCSKQDGGDELAVDRDEDDGQEIQSPLSDVDGSDEDDNAIENERKNNERFLIRSTSRENNINDCNQGDTNLHYLLTKQPRYARKPRDNILLEGDMNMETTFQATYEDLAEKRLAEWRGNYDDGDNILNQQQQKNTGTDRSSNQDDQLVKNATHGANDARCCYITVYDKNMNRLEKVTGRKRSKHRPSTSLRPGFSNFFGPEGSTTKTQPLVSLSTTEHIIRADEEESIRNGHAITAKDANLSPLFQNEYTSKQMRCDRAIEQDIRYVNQNPQAGRRASRGQEVEQQDHYGQQIYNRIEHPDCTCGKHHLLIDNRSGQDTNGHHQDNGYQEDGLLKKKRTKFQSRRYEKKQGQATTEDEQDRYLHYQDASTPVNRSRNARNEEKHKKIETMTETSMHPNFNVASHGKKQQPILDGNEVAVSSINKSDRVIDMRNLRSSLPENHLTFPGENRRLPLKRKIKDNPNLIDHIQQNDIINESHRQQKRHPVGSEQMNCLGSQGHLPRQPMVRHEADIRRNTFRSEDHPARAAISRGQLLQQYHQQSEQQQHQTEQHQQRNQPKEDRPREVHQQHPKPLHRSKSTVALDRRPIKGPEAWPNKSINNNNKISKSRSGIENADQTIETITFTQETRDKLHKTCQQQHFSIFDNDYPKPKDFDDISSSDYKRWPSRNSNRNDNSPTDLAVTDASGTGAFISNNRQQRVKSYNDLFRESPDSIFAMADRYNNHERTPLKSVVQLDNDYCKCPVLRLGDRFDYIGENYGHKFYVKK